MVAGQLSRAALPITTEAAGQPSTVCTVASVQYTAYRVQAAGCCPRQHPCYYYVSGFSLTVELGWGTQASSCGQEGGDQQHTDCDMMDFSMGRQHHTTLD